MRPYTKLLSGAACLFLGGALLASAPAPGRAADDASWTEVTLKVEPAVEPKFRTPKDGTSNGGTLRGNWSDVTSGILPLKGPKGGPIRFDPKFGKVNLDTDGDGSFESQPKGDTFAVKALREGGATSLYVFRLRREYEKWWFQRACQAVGEIDKAKVTFLDDDNDGAFNTLAKDVVHVQGMTGAAYLGKLLPVKGKLYELEVDPSGTKARYRPWAPPDGASPGKIDAASGFRAKGKPAIVSVARKGEPEVVFDVNVKGGQTVPPGEYELVEAIVGPSRDQVCVVTKGRMQDIVVKPGETATLQWGVPGTIDFAMTKEGSLVTIAPSSVELLGRAGEKYEKFEPSAPPSFCEMVEKVSRRRVWSGGAAAVSGLRVACDVPYEVRLTNDNVDYLGPFQSEWR